MQEAIRDGRKYCLKERLGIRVINGILRCVSRYEAMDLSEDNRAPILLPTKRQADRRRSASKELAWRDTDDSLHRGRGEVLDSQRKNGGKACDKWVQDMQTIRSWT
ncbi:unnamed protein product, partial [Toxocara canis]|uniref:Uncharacterized protein n=1 Tax=Toxocara canis TaxID=6265 RepID=A0A183U6V0_TOXCA